MLAHRPRRWPSIGPTWDQFVVFAGKKMEELPHIPPFDWQINPGNAENNDCLLRLIDGPLRRGVSPVLVTYGSSPGVNCVIMHITVGV